MIVNTESKLSSHHPMSANQDRWKLRAVPDEGCTFCVNHEMIT